MNKDFFLELKNQVQQDLSQAHLTPHFYTAQNMVKYSDHSVSGVGVWSAPKPNDTLIYSNGTVSGKKHWVSGVSLSQWVAVAAIENNQKIIVLISSDQLALDPVNTSGMEDTLTVNFICDQVSAVKLFDWNAPELSIIFRCHMMSFITNHLGLAQALFYDIDEYTKQNNFDYIKKKTKLDIEILQFLWEKEIGYDFSQTQDQSLCYSLMYAFAKKTLFSVTSLVTEFTGSGIYDTTMSGHQRYKDALIYSTHMKNISTALDLVNS